MARFAFNEKLVAKLRGAVDVFKNAGCTTWTVPNEVTCATFEVWGAGGGGGARCCCDCYHQSSGGTGGRYAAMTIPVTPGCVYTVCVGFGGMTTAVGAGVASHWCCFGGDGSASFVAGDGITTLCAAGGGGSNNMCYSHCMCGGVTVPSTTGGACALSTVANTALVSCETDSHLNQRGQRNSTSIFTNVWTDASGMNYGEVIGGVAWSGASMIPNDVNGRAGCCSTGWAGLGGQGYHGQTHCNCCQGGVGRNGLVLIRY